MRPVFTTLCLLVTLARALPAQSLPAITLAAANATLDDDFVGLTSVRELADGRVLLTDGRDQQIYLADFTTRRATAVSRKGKGPLEYSFVGQLYATRGDSTIMMDLSNQRWLLFAGARVAGTVPPDHPAVRATSVILGADRLGRVLTTRSDEFTEGVKVYSRKDSLEVLLVDRASGKVDTVARLREMPRQATQSRDKDGKVIASSTMATEYSARPELAHLSNDGALAILRLEPLRVDWRTANGRWTLGKPLPVVGATVTTAERAALQKGRAGMLEAMQKAGVPLPPEPTLPRVMPALDAGRPLELPDGRIALKRRSPAAAPSSRYLVINRAGAIDGEITLAPNEQIVGFGVTSVYVSFKDADDVQRLRRHAWTAR